jgi:hypothetical protein
MIVVARSSFSAMIMLTCVSLIVGAALGQRLTFLVLIPAIGCALAVVAGFGVAVRLDLWSTILAMILTATGLQIGYLAGATIRVLAARHVKGSLDVLSPKPITPDHPDEEPRDDLTPSLNGQADRIGVAAHEYDGDQRGLRNHLTRIPADGEDPLDEPEDATQSLRGRNV